jgi:hypothetical protein
MDGEGWIEVQAGAGVVMDNALRAGKQASQSQAANPQFQQQSKPQE